MANTELPPATVASSSSSRRRNFIMVENILSDLDFQLNKRGFPSFKEGCRWRGRKNYITYINGLRNLEMLTWCHNLRLPEAIAQQLRLDRPSLSSATPRVGEHDIIFVSMFDVEQSSKWVRRHINTNKVSEVRSLKSVISIGPQVGDMWYGCNCSLKDRRKWVEGGGEYIDLSPGTKVEENENQNLNQGKEYIQNENGANNGMEIVKETVVSPLKRHESSTSHEYIPPPPSLHIWDEFCMDRLPSTMKVISVLLKHLNYLAVADEQEEEREKAEKKEDSSAIPAAKRRKCVSDVVPIWKQIKHAIADINQHRSDEFLHYADGFCRRELSRHLRTETLAGLSCHDDFMEYSLAFEKGSPTCRAAVNRGKREVAIMYSTTASSRGHRTAPTVYRYYNVDDDLLGLIERGQASRDDVSAMITEKDIPFTTSTIFPVVDEQSVDFSPLSSGSQDQINWSKLLCLAFYNYFLSCTPTESVLFEPLENLQRMNNVFDSCKHLMTYYESTEWCRNAVRSISKMVCDCREANSNNTSTNHLKELYKESRRRLSMVVSGIDADPIALKFTGVATTFTKRDYDKLSSAFTNDVSALYHLSPLFPVARGLVFIMLTMSMVDRKMKAKHVSHHKNHLTLTLQGMLLRSREDFKASGAPGHAYDAFKFARGICWERHIIDLNDSNPLPTIQQKLLEAVNDLDIPSHTKLLLEHKLENLSRSDRDRTSGRDQYLLSLSHSTLRTKLKRDKQRFQEVYNEQTPRKSKFLGTEKLVERVFEGVRNDDVVSRGSRLLYRLPSCQFTLFPIEKKSSISKTSTDRIVDELIHSNLSDDLHDDDALKQVAEELSFEGGNSIEVGVKGEIRIHEDSMENNDTEGSSNQSSSISSHHESELFNVERLAALKYLNKIADSSIFKCSNICLSSARCTCKGKVTLTSCKASSDYDGSPRLNKGLVQILGTVNRTSSASDLRPLDDEYEYEWVVAHSEARIWRALLHTLLAEVLNDDSHCDDQDCGNQMNDSKILVRGRSQIIQGPLDLLPGYYSSWINSSVPPPLSSFYQNKHDSITERLKQLSELVKPSELRAEFRRCFDMKTPNYWLDEDYYRMEDLVVDLGGQRMGIIFKSMLEEPESYMRGQPDLLFWKARRIDPDRKKPVGKKPSSSLSHVHKEGVSQIEYTPPPKEKDSFLSDVDIEIGHRINTGPWLYENVFAVEVKSARDVLSPWQVLWARLLSDAQVEFELCKIAEKVL